MKAASDASPGKQDHACESPERGQTITDNNTAFLGIIGSEGCLKAQIELAKAAVVYPPTGLHTLICGETGVGKSLLAEGMWRYATEVGAFGAKSKETIPFVTFCCAEYADNPQLLLSHLFGYVKGAFTGADSEHEGLVDRARGGILFLDEIHRLPPVGQELLFMLVDKGCFRRLGESSDERPIRLMLIGATSEDVTSSLLTTFRRRIPVQITLPSLSERPVRERIALILHFVEQETRRLGLPIWISGQALRVFSYYHCPANIGELRNDLQLCCAKSYLSYLAAAADKLTVDIDVIPQRIFSMVSDEGVPEANVLRLFREGVLVAPGSQPLVQNLLNDYELPVDLYGFIDKKIDYYRQSSMSADEVEQQVAKDLEKYFNAAVQAFFKPDITDMPTSIIQPDVWETANFLLNHAATKLDRKFGRKTLVALALHMQQFKERAASGQLIYNPHLKKIETEHADAYGLVLANAGTLSEKLGFHITADEIGFLSMFLAQTFEDKVKQRIGVVIAAHGRATAQNMAEVANTLLGTDHIKSFDIPLHKNTSTTIAELQQIIIKADEGKGVLLLVDMGFLVTMEKTLAKAVNIPVQVIPNVTTAMVLEAGRRVLTTEESLDQAAANICDAYREYTIALMRRRYSETSIGGTILTVCATGIGTAEKIREILVDGIPDAALMNIVPVSANDDIRHIAQQLGTGLKLIVGSLNPGVPGVPFVHVSELLNPAGIDHICALLARNNQESQRTDGRAYREQDVLTLLAGQLNKFVKNLPIDQVQTCCEDLVGRITKLVYDNRLSQDALIRIYLHTACMLDRIRGGEALLMPEWGKQVQEERKKDFEQLQQIVAAVSNTMDLAVPDSEICYFLITLPDSREQG